MQSKYVLFIVIAILLFACKTERHVVKRETHEKVDSVVNRDIETSEEVQQQIDSSIEYRDLQAIIDNSTSVITLTEYSKPDSTGKQYIERQIVVDKQSNVRKLDESSVSKITQATTLIKRKTSDNSKIRFNRKLDTFEKSKDKSHVPFWLIFGGIVFVMIVAVVAYIYIKKII